MKQIEHLHPKEVYEEEREFMHKLELIDSGEHIGELELMYKNHPFPFYYLSYLNIDKPKRGKGYSGFFLENINKFLDSKGKAGLLLNTIYSKDPTSSIYARHGWQEIEGHLGWYIYNAPKNLTKDRVDSAIKDIVAMIERKQKDNQGGVA